MQNAKQVLSLSPSCLKVKQEKIWCEETAPKTYGHFNITSEI